MKYLKKYENENDLIVGSYYSFKSFFTETKYLLKLIMIHGDSYQFVPIQDLLYPPFRYFKGQTKIDKFTLDNWIEERDFKEETWFRESTDPILWGNIHKYNL